MQANNSPYPQDASGSSLPPHATEASLLRYELAQILVAAAPSSFGQEAILSGSTARGFADEDSDIEMVFYVDVLPSASDRKVWLERVGVAEIAREGVPSGDDEFWMRLLFRGIWVEAGWQVIPAMVKLLDKLAAGEVIAHGQLKLAWVVKQAVSLRGGSLLQQWQQKLVRYPEPLAQKLIAAAVHHWFFPQTFKIRWALIHRGELLALIERLYVDTCSMLRILFAINQQWEPDWKWLRVETEQLIIKPERLLERIDEICTIPQAEQRVTLYLLLMRDVLALVPPQYDVAGALMNVQESLQAHGFGGKDAAEESL
jgi:hypothetical protein